MSDERERAGRRNADPARTDPHSWSDLGQAVTEKVALRLKADFRARRLEGTATLAFRGPATGAVDLDARGLSIEGAKADGTSVPFELSSPDPVKGERLTVHAPAGTRELEIRYRTSPDASALQWLEPSQTAGKKHPYLFSQCQAIHARSIAPLQDTPRARIRYEAEIEAPEGLVALMSAASRGRQGNVHRFEMRQSIPPYLLALAVGDIAGKDLSPRSRVYAEPSVVDEAAREFEDVERMMKSAEALFGPYDWERFDLLVMPPSFPYGGMENPRLTFLTPTLLAGDKSQVDVVAHELAHSWTGNLVSNADANHFWLNEGFTVYAERRIVEALWGSELAALKSDLGRIELAHDVARLGPASPHTRLRTSLDGVDPDDVYSLVPYEKGYQLLVLLERAVGRAAFDRFLARYLARWRFQSIGTSEFEATIEEELPGALARVDGKVWIDGPGVPANAPAFPAPKVEAIRKLAAGWPGLRPSPSVAREWSANELHLYLRALPLSIDRDGCRWLDETFSLTTRGNMEVLCAWLAIAATSDYRPAFPRIREVLLGVGRMRYLKPLYAALAARPENLPFAREVFAQAKSGYHAIAAGGVRAILKL